MSMNLIDRIENLMRTDDDDRDEQSGYLIRAYASADPAGRERIDDAFIALCGYSLTRLQDEPDLGADV